MATSSSKKKAVADEKTKTMVGTEEKPVKIDKWDGTAVKNALDDGVKKIMRETFGYKEDHKVVDCKLLICTISCVFAIVALIYDYLHPFPASRNILITCVISYFVMMGILTLYTTYIEKNNIMFAVQKDEAGLGPDHHWRVCSMLKRFDHMYWLSLHFKDGETSKEREASLNKSIGSWFDEDGVLLVDLLEQDVREMHGSISSEKKDK